MKVLVIQRALPPLNREFPNREMEFVAMNGISYLSLDEELLELMFVAGFSQLKLALVSSDKTVRKRRNARTT
jgi:hypothetical protein